jgi:hypothetical protein
MRLQKAKKLTKNSSLLLQTPNRKQALRKKTIYGERKGKNKKNEIFLFFPFLSPKDIETVS